MGRDPFAGFDPARLESGLAVGLGRSAVETPAAVGGSPQPVLATLALLAQRQRFRRPLPPSGLSADPVLPSDPRPVVPAAARAILLRLLADPAVKSTWDGLTLAVVDRLDAAGLRLHPFDLPKLERQLRPVAGQRRLGPTEAAWLKLGAAPAVQPVADEITEETWETFPKPERTVFLQQLRRDQPERAVEVIEAAYPGQPAVFRADLVRVLQAGAGTADVEFLTRALGDRAGSVKQAAREILAAIPGTGPYTERRAEALAAIKKKSSRMGGGAARLTFQTKRKGGAAARLQAAVQALDGIALADIAGHFEMPVDALLAAAEDDHPLHFTLLGNAAREGRWPLVFDQAGRDEADWETILGAARDALSALPDDRRREIAREILGRTGFESFDSPGALAWLYELLAGPLDAGSADRLLAGAGWRKLAKRLKKEDSDVEPAVLAVVAALMPDACAERFLAAIEPLPHEARRDAVLFHQFLAALPMRD